jgi:hypothetical protein
LLEAAILQRAPPAAGLAVGQENKVGDK